MHVNLIFKISYGDLGYTTSVPKSLETIPDKIALSDGKWIFDKTSGVTFFPYDEKSGRACYDVEYFIIADRQEVHDILREIKNIS